MSLLPLSTLRSIGQYNSSDYFAILGLPVNANSMQIRQRYLNIVRNLHPDIYGRTVEEKHKACEYLAKLVSPAYNMLMYERERAEYLALIKLIAKRLVKRELKIAPKSELARKLLHSPSEPHYMHSVEAIAKLQYQSLDRILEYTDQLGELNLIYSMYQEGYHPSLFEARQDIISYTLNLPSLPSLPSLPPPPQKTDIKCQPSQDIQPRDSQKQLPNRVQSYLRLVEDYFNQSPGDAPDCLSDGVQISLQLAEYHIDQKQWMMAWGVLHTALQLDPTNSKCHALLGIVYLNQKLVGMAKISFRQALKINPREPLALKYIVKCLIPRRNTFYEYIRGNGFFGWLGGS
jgi:tetratricopeptide (TPR) repeat protein